MSNYHGWFFVLNLPYQFREQQENDFSVIQVNQATAKNVC